MCPRWGLRGRSARRTGREKIRSAWFCWQSGRRCKSFGLRMRFGEGSGIFDALHPSPRAPNFVLRGPSDAGGAGSGALAADAGAGGRAARSGALAAWRRTAFPCQRLDRGRGGNARRVCGVSDALAYLVVVALTRGLERQRLFGLRVEIRRVVQFTLARQALTVMTIAPLVAL